MLPPDLPPVSNKVLYAYRVFIKWFSFFFFGLNTFLLGILVFPLMRLVLHPRRRFQKYGRRLVSVSFRFFIRLMHLLGIVNFEPGNRKDYRRLSSKIIVANHPSILDVVMLISLFPNADCIVNAYLDQHIVRWVIRQLYIINSRSFEEIMESCSATLIQGNCLIIFPEGTRTPRSGKVMIKKGAARVSLISGCGIVPVHIGGTDKYGLGKKDPWTAFNPTERYVYRISMENELRPEHYQGHSMPAAVRAYTNDIKKVLFPDKEV